MVVFSRKFYFLMKLSSFLCQLCLHHRYLSINLDKEHKEFDILAASNIQAEKNKIQTNPKGQMCRKTMQVWLAAEIFFTHSGLTNLSLFSTKVTTEIGMAWTYDQCMHFSLPTNSLSVQLWSLWFSVIMKQCCNHRHYMNRLLNLTNLVIIFNTN